MGYIPILYLSCKVTYFTICNRSKNALPDLFYIEWVGRIFKIRGGAPRKLHFWPPPRPPPGPPQNPPKSTQNRLLSHIPKSDQFYRFLDPIFDFFWSIFIIFLTIFYCFFHHFLLFFWSFLLNFYWIFDQFLSFFWPFFIIFSANFCCFFDQFLLNFLLFFIIYKHKITTSILKFFILDDPYAPI